ncbi:MAG: hypothetical protein RL380_266 [Verrucomicrobiota bacterium]|jgi:hypothetical protein
MWRRLKFYAEWLLAGACAVGVAWGQQMQPVDDQVQTLSDDDPRVNPAADPADKPELPVQQIARNAEPPYQNMFYTVGSAGRMEPKVGGLRASLPDVFNAGFNFHAPFLQSQGAATNAEFQVGRFYYDLTSLSASLLYSDNVDRSELNARGGAISIVSLRGLAYIQLLENLRFSANLGFVLLPLRGKFGVAGFMHDSASARLFFSEDEKLRAQIAYDLQLGNWNWLVYDEVRAREALFAERFNLVAGGPFDGEDRQGRYSFRSPFGLGSQTRVNETDKRYKDAFVYAQNQVGVTASRMLPTVTKMSVGAYRSDYFYFGGDDSFLPHSRDVGFVTLRSERESLRFKPYAGYQIYRYNDRAWDQEARVGAQGPLTENINVSGSVGWFRGGHINRERMLAHGRIQHDINPHLNHSFSYRRDVTAPEQDLEESYIYNVHSILGPYLKADVFIAKSMFEDLDGNNTGTDEWRGGILLTTDTSAKTSFRFGVVYASIKYLNSVQGEWDRWTGIAEARHHFTDTFEARVSYQYQTRKSTLIGDSYDENLAVVTLTKYFH